VITEYATGIFVGKEGPFVHMAGLVANQLCRLPLFKSIQEVLFPAVCFEIS
jgi:hypothetical protein